MIILTILLLPLATAIFSVNAAIVNKTWNISAKNIAPDGFTRTAALVNGVYPGPLLKAQKGDTVFVTVNNQLNDPTMRKSTSIHWHGLFQSRNAFNDGPSFVTQCPIAPNHTYTYKLVLGQQAGTFWYHSHLSTQYVDGIRGPLVIYDPLDRNRLLYDVDDENTVITLTDWYHQTALSATNEFFAGGPEPVPDSGLINSAGRYNGGPAVPRTRINVAFGLRYRFRIISVSAEGFFDFAIDQHKLKVIEADGISTKPYSVDSITILPGQRYSVVVNANQPVKNYWIRATHIVRGSTTSTINPNLNGNDTYAVLHYAGAGSGEPTAPQPTTLPPGGVAFQEFNLVPLVNPGAPGGSAPPDCLFNFTFNFAGPNADIWLINGIQYQPPSIPTLLNILANGATKDSDFGPNENTFVLPYNATVEVAFIGGAGHAFHLHGHAFDVIQSASGGPPNYVNPPRRDVVASGGTTENPMRIRFRTDNPGPWFIHCHIDWHLEAGLAAVFAEDPAGIRSGPQSVVPNAAWQQLCKTYNALSPSDR